MEAPDGSPPQSLCMIRAAEFYPKSQMEKEDPQLAVPFQELAGESVKFLGRTSDGILALSNYRISLLKNSSNSETSVPLGLIESLQARDLFQLIVNCKDASTVKCSFETAEQCAEWHRRIQLLVGVPGSLESLFAFPFCSWTFDGITTHSTSGAPNGGSMVGDGFYADNSNGFAYPASDERLQRAFRYEDDFMREVERLNFDLNGPWRISHANEDFKLCPSYPRKILVPCCISDETLHNVANFRASRRLPAVVWRHPKSGAVLARSSQPEVGWLGWRNSKDEQLLKALADACAFDRGEQLRQLTQTTSGQAMPSGDSTPSSPDGSHEEVVLDEVRKVLIVDARSYTSAVTNRARGGGCECIEYYPCAEIEFMNLGNIHVIRKSFHSLRQLCASPPDIPNWLGLLEKTMWLQHLSGLLAASMTVCHAIEKKGRPVLVHCSDGWDRTPQLVATAQLCLDPFYRTVEGFRILVEREWLSYGHKFADRCGHGPGSDELNERCPVFLQWLDLVHQIHKQFPCSFEFSMGYLIKLAQHSHSCLFGTFLCNTLKERIDKSVLERTFSVWPFLSGPIYRNPLYMPNREKVLWPAHNVRDLSLWTEVYLGSLGNQNCIDFPNCGADELHGSMSPMVKTRSYGDLNSAGILQNGISRRSSDPNMIVDPNLIVDSNSENNSVADIQSEREDSPDITRKLQNVTINLMHHGTEKYKSLQQHEPPYEEQLQSARQITHSKDNECEQVSEKGDAGQLQTSRVPQQIQQQPQPEKQLFTATNGDNILPTTFFANPKMRNLSETDYAKVPTDCGTAATLPETVTFVPAACLNPIASATPSSSDAQQNSFNEFLHTLNELTNGTADNCNESSQNGQNSDEHIEVGAATIRTTGITIHKTTELNLDMLESVDLGDPTCNILSPCNALAQSGHSDTQENMWHGSVNTSTDTLVPIETHKQQLPIANGSSHLVEALSCDTTDGSGGDTVALANADNLTTPTPAFARDDRKSIANISTNCSILPKVHSASASVAGNGRPHVLSALASNVSAAATTAPNSCATNEQTNSDHSCDNKLTLPFAAQASSTTTNNNTSVPADINTYPMEESILILPEHQKLEISLSGKCETILNNGAAAATTTTSTPAVGATPITTATPGSYSYAPFTAAYAQRRRRTSSSNSRPDGLCAKQLNGSTFSRFSIPGVRSLPMTPPGLPERPQIAISCPDGLAHALSEQNIRLQQIVHEHKLRVEELLREMRDMRMALLKKICPNCNNVSVVNDEQCSALENVENASICSWEALEDQSGPSSCASSSTQPNATSIRWVPDHAVSRCTSCQTEFWLGRRKHHCRSCGQIFCADCSEFAAALPDEKLFNPVRLCGPCYHAVTTRVQMHQLQNSTLLQLQQSAAKTAANAVAVAAVAVSAAATASTAAATSKA